MKTNWSLEDSLKNIIYSMIEKRKIYVGIGLFLVVIIATIIGGYLTFLPTYYRLSKYGIETLGTVISKEENNHQYIRVEYKIDNNKFITGGHAGDFGKSFFTVKLNEKVPVYYNPDEPEESCLGKPDSHLNRSIKGTCFVSTFPIIILIIHLIRKKAK